MLAYDKTKDNGVFDIRLTLDVGVGVGVSSLVLSLLDYTSVL